MNKELDMLGDYIRDLEATNKELNDDITWWTNRFNAVQRDYENLQQRIDKAIDYVKKHTDKLKTIRVPKIDFDYNELLEILEAKNEQ